MDSKEELAPLSLWCENSDWHCRRKATMNNNSPAIKVRSVALCSDENIE
jgi:hypothetical protein